MRQKCRFAPLRGRFDSEFCQLHWSHKYFKGNVSFEIIASRKINYSLFGVKIDERACKTHFYTLDHLHILHLPKTKREQMWVNFTLIIWLRLESGFIHSWGIFRGCRCFVLEMLSDESYESLHKAQKLIDLLNRRLWKKYSFESLILCNFRKLGAFRIIT